MSIESGEVHDWPPVTSAHASRGQPDATRSLAVRPVASIQSASDPLKAAKGVASLNSLAPLLRPGGERLPLEGQGSVPLMESAGSHEYQYHRCNLPRCRPCR